jgi:hypothetical protein
MNSGFKSQCVPSHRLLIGDQPHLYKEVHVLGLSILHGKDSCS